MVEKDSDDATLVRRFQTGDGDCFSELVRRWDANVFALAFRIMGRAEDAEEVRQLTFLRVHRGLNQFQDEARFSTWIYRIVVNLCRDALRSRASRERRERSTAMVRGLRLAVPPTDPDTAPSEVVQAVSELSSDTRAIIVLRHFHNMPLVEIARILDLPATTVRSRASTGLRQLAERLGHLAPRLWGHQAEANRGL